MLGNYQGSPLLLDMACNFGSESFVTIACIVSHFELLQMLNFYLLLTNMTKKS